MRLIENPWAIEGYGSEKLNCQVAKEEFHTTSVQLKDIYIVTSC
jgi:hypothetical protein